jgi:hypothetical protein
MEVLSVTKFKMLRLEKGLRQDDVSGLTLGKISQRRISDFDRGLIPTPSEAQILSNLFGCSTVEELFPGLEQPERRNAA